MTPARKLSTISRTFDMHLLMLIEEIKTRNMSIADVERFFKLKFSTSTCRKYLVKLVELEIATDISSHRSRKLLMAIIPDQELVALRIQEIKDHMGTPPEIKAEPEIKTPVVQDITFKGTRSENHIPATYKHSLLHVLLFNRVYGLNFTD